MAIFETKCEKYYKIAVDVGEGLISLTKYLSITLIRDIITMMGLTRRHEIVSLSIHRECLPPKLIVHNLVKTRPQRHIR